MMQFLSIRGRRLHLLLSMKLERKANPSLPTLMPELERKPKKEMKPKPQQMKAWKHKCTGVVDISQVKSRRPNQSMPNPKKNYQRKFLTPKIGNCQGQTNCSQTQSEKNY
jgi:hypothetical protein